MEFIFSLKYRIFFAPFLSSPVTHLLHWFTSVTKANLYIGFGGFSFGLLLGVAIGRSYKNALKPKAAVQAVGISSFSGVDVGRN